MSQSPTNPDLMPSDALKRMTPHMLAVTMLRQIMEKKDWQAAEPDITARAYAKAPMACDFYQLRIFLDLIKQRFGQGVFNLVESSLITVTQVGGKKSGNNIFSRFMEAISIARELGPVEEFRDNKNIGIDCQVADQILTFIDESDEEKQAFRFVLAESLTYARVWAEEIFPQLVAKIEFDPSSVAFVKVETAYKGLTNRWRESPGYFERCLQRKEGNPLFPESQRNPSYEEILLAQTKDDNELAKLELDVKEFMSDFKKLIDQGQMSQGTILELMQHSIEPLMIRAAEIGHLSAAQLHLKTLTKLMDSLLCSLSLTPDQIDGFRNDWRRRTNVFVAQEWRQDDTTTNDCEGDPLLCESVEDMEQVLNIYLEFDPALVDKRRRLALIGLDIAKSQDFTLPGAEKKLALFVGDAAIDSEPNEIEQRGWWQFWRSKAVAKAKDN